MADYKRQREQMVERQLKSRDITHKKVLHAMREVPRELFVPDHFTHCAYQDSALPIGSEQTISQPYVVALTVQAIDPQPDHIVLDVGTGSGYAAAVASKIVKEVFSVERIKSLVHFASKNLMKADCNNVHIRHGDGALGWPENAPYDGVVVSAASSDIPGDLKNQLREDGHLVMPVGGGLLGQQLKRYTKRVESTIQRSNLGAVRFVPLISGKE